MMYNKTNAIICMTLFLSLLLSACGSSTPKEDSNLATESIEVNIEKTTEVVTVENSLNQSAEDYTEFDVNLDGVTTIEELENLIEAHLKNCIDSLDMRWKTLSEEIDSFNKYCDEKEKVTEFYETIEDETNQMCIMLREYSVVYARMILDSDMSEKDKYKAVDGINDCIYDDACDEINDEIYDGILDEMNDHFYDGILEEGKDEVNYDKWYDICSDEYSQWYDTSSAVYKLYYDTASDVYSFYYDISAALYKGDSERAEKVINRFLQKIDKRKGNGINISSNIVFDTNIRSASSTDEIETIIEEHVSECIQALYSEWLELAEENNTYDKYIENVDAIEGFYKHIEDATAQILNMIGSYGVAYADLLMQSDSSAKDKYADFEDLKNCVYEDACKMVKDDIYDGLLNDMKSYYYEGIIKDAKSDIAYSKWSDARSDEYGWWSDTRSEVYSEWSNVRSDLYSFWSDMRSELYKGDINGANEKLDKFRGKVGEDSSANVEANIEINSDSVNSKSENTGQKNNSSGLRPEFKEAMDSYEAFYDEYCDFMKKYKENPTDIELVKEYMDMLQKLEEMDNSFEKWEDDDLNDEEMQYYIDVTIRIEKKLLDTI